MEGQPRNIVVNGQYIAHMEVDTQIIGVGYVYNINPQAPKHRPDRVEDVTPAQEDKTHESSAIPPDFFCISAQFTEDSIRKRLAAELSQSTTKIEYCRALYRLQHMGCINIDQYASDAKRAAVLNEYQSKYKLAPNDFCRARMNL